MQSSDYERAFDETLFRLAELNEQWNAIEIERAKLKQFLLATLEMMDESARNNRRLLFQKAVEEYNRQQIGLGEAIRHILERHRDRWLTASEVRDRLRESGFDFSKYESNPLASVSTTLTRMYPKLVDKTSIEGVTGYRIKRSALFDNAIRAARKRAFIGTSSDVSGGDQK